MVRKVVAASALAVGLVVAAAMPAWAHVTLSPDSADKGGSDVEIAFRVPNEDSSASTTKVAVAIPTDHPIAAVLALAVPGWTAAVQSSKLPKPIHTDDGDVTDAVSQVTWTADNAASGVKPGEFGKFEIIAGQLPEDATEIVFKAVQTYSNGDVVRWIETQTAGGPEPEHPAPVLSLTAPGRAGEKPTTTTPAATASVKGLAKKTDVDSAKTVGIIAIVVGAVGLLLGGAALVAPKERVIPPFASTRR